MLKRILIISQWFPPEPAPIGIMLNEIAEGMVAWGYQVTIITGFPNHPGGQIYGGFRKRLWQTIDSKGAKIVRVYLYTSPRKTFFRKALTYVTFSISSCIAALCVKRHDILFIVNQPLTLGPVGWLIKEVKKTIFIFNVQDIYPDVAVLMGVLKNRTVIAFLRQLERFTYRKADYITVIAESFRRNLLSKGINDDKIKLLPNWIDTDEISPLGKINYFSGEGLENKFVVLYAGTIGLISGADILLACAEQLRYKSDIVFVFVGEGVLKGTLEREAEFRSLDNMKFFPFQPRQMLSSMLATADVCIVSLLKHAGETSVPSKVIAYMAAGRPVIASVDLKCETAEVIKQANCGKVVSPGDSSALTTAILELFNDRNQAKSYGKNGRAYVTKYLSKKVVVPQYAELLDALPDASMSRHRSYKH